MSSKKVPVEQRVNCINCKHLQWSDDLFIDHTHQPGYICTGQDYFKYCKPHYREQQHLRQLRNPKYLETAKKCCVPKSGTKTVPIDWINYKYKNNP